VNAAPAITEAQAEEIREVLRDSPYLPRPIRDDGKRARRTKGQIEGLCELIEIRLSNDHPMTVRQLFYRLVSEGVIDKTETEYKNVVVRLLGQLRRQEKIPFSWIADNTRWMRKPCSYNSLEDALRRTAEHYRRDLWAAQDAYVEVWLEKEALAGVVYPETAQWDVPLMVTRGYPSLSFVHAAAEIIDDTGKPAYIYYFGDRDPSGVDISRHVEERLRELAPAAEIHFERVAIEPWQIGEWNLPTRPTKKTDTRAKKFKGESVELDALPPDILRGLVRRSIINHLDADLVGATERIEEAERATLEGMIWGMDE